MYDDDMDASSIRRNLQRARVVHVWFWDGEREYTGEAEDLSPSGIVALLKMSQFGDATVVPTHAIVGGLGKHLKSRSVDFKVSARGMEASVKGKVTLLRADAGNSRRLIIEAAFYPSSERNQLILSKLGRFVEATKNA